MTSIKMNYETCLCEVCKNYRKEKCLPEPDPNEAYNAEVRRIAEILADIEHPVLFKVLRDVKILPCEDITAQKVIEEKLSQARAMVAEMNSMHYKGFITGLAAKDQFPLDNEKSIDSINKYYKSILIERGLIPSPEQTKCSNCGIPDNDAKYYACVDKILCKYCVVTNRKFNSP